MPFLSLVQSVHLSTLTMKIRLIFGGYNFLVLCTDPQKQYADAVIQVLPTQLIPDDNEGKVLRVRMVMREGVKYFEPVYLFDEGSTINWIPCGRKLTCSYPGIKFFYGPDTYYGNEV
jgi:phosphoribulokinase